MRNTTLLCLLTAAILAAPATAQPVQGDLVLTSDKNPAGVYTTTWPSSTLRTLYPGLITSGLRMACKNSCLRVIGGNTGNIYQLTSLGSLYTITSATPPGCTAMDLDQDISYMVVNSTDGRLYRVEGITVTTFKSMNTSSGHPNAICRDGNTGNWIVGCLATGKLFRVSRTDGYAMEIYGGDPMSGILGIACMPQTGTLAVVRYRYVVPPIPGKTIQELAIIDGETVKATREIKDASAVAVNHKTGRIHVATASGSVVELSYAGRKLTVLASRSYGSHGFTGIDFWSDQNVSVDTTGRRGTQAWIYLKFDHSQKMPYVVALSLSQRPGIAFGPANVLNLTPDPFFFLTAAGALPYFTSGFTGKTNNLGQANAYLSLPGGLPYWTCIYVGAVAVNSAFPNNLDVGNVECIQVH